MHNGILFRLNKEEDPASFDNLAVTGGYCAK